MTPVAIDNDGNCIWHDPGADPPYYSCGEPPTEGERLEIEAGCPLVDEDGGHDLSRGEYPTTEDLGNGSFEVECPVCRTPILAL